MSIFDRFKLTGKRLFISGGSRGLGREMALAVADAGADVILVGRDPPSLETTAGDIRSLGRQAWTIVADVGKPSECEQACRSALESHGPIDILINNVGGRRENIPTESMTLDKWRELMDLNLTSCMLCTKWLGAAMIERGRGGRIINIASINALVAGRGIAGRHYETAKAAMLQFTRALDGGYTLWACFNAATAGPAVENLVDPVPSPRSQGARVEREELVGADARAPR